MRNHPFALELLAEGLLQQNDAPVRFRSLPDEWCFTQACDAALFALQLQLRAMRHNLSLSAISPFDIAFRDKRPFYTSSLALTAERGKPWQAYESFCRQFLGPLFLMREGNSQANRLLKEQPRGLALNEISRRLGAGSYLNLDALLHIHLHARAQRDLPDGFFLRSGEGWTGRTGPSLIGSLLKAVHSLRKKGLPKQDNAPSSGSKDQSRLHFVKQVIGLWTPAAAVVIGQDFATHMRVLQPESVPCAVLQPSPQQAETIYTAPSSSSIPILTSEPLQVLQRWNQSVDLGLALDLPSLLFNASLHEVASALRRCARLLLVECQPHLLSALLSHGFTLVRLGTNPPGCHQLALLKSNS